MRYSGDAQPVRIVRGSESGGSKDERSCAEEPLLIGPSHVQRVMLNVVWTVSDGMGGTGRTGGEAGRALKAPASTLGNISMALL
jgi:hypothetical protein